LATLSIYGAAGPPGLKWAVYSADTNPDYNIKKREHASSSTTDPDYHCTVFPGARLERDCMAHRAALADEGEVAQVGRQQVPQPVVSGGRAVRISAEIIDV